MRVREEKRGHDCLLQGDGFNRILVLSLSEPFAFPVEHQFENRYTGKSKHLSSFGIWSYLVWVSDGERGSPLVQYANLKASCLTVYRCFHEWWRLLVDKLHCCCCLVFWPRHYMQEEQRWRGIGGGCLALSACFLAQPMFVFWPLNSHLVYERFCGEGSTHTSNSVCYFYTFIYYHPFL